MNCTETQHAFTDYLDDSLDRATAAQLDDHLRQCPECHLALNQLRQTLQLLQSMEEMVPPPDLLAGIHARLAPAPTLLSRLINWWEQGVNMSWQTATATVAIAFAAMVVVKTFSPMAPAPPDASLRAAGRSPHPVIELDTRSVTSPYERPRQGPFFTAPDLPSTSRTPFGWREFSPPSPDRAAVVPDLTLTVGPLAPARQADLHRQLKAHCNCATRFTGEEMLIYLPATELTALQQVLARQRIILPGQDLLPAAGGKQVLLVALRLR